MFNSLKRIFKKKERKVFKDLINPQCPSCEKIMKCERQVSKIRCCKRFVHTECYNIDIQHNDGCCKFCNTRIISKLMRKENKWLLWAILIM